MGLCFFKSTYIAKFQKLWTQLLYSTFSVYQGGGGGPLPLLLQLLQQGGGGGLPGQLLQLLQQGAGGSSPLPSLLQLLQQLGGAGGGSSLPHLLELLTQLFWTPELQVEGVRTKAFIDKMGLNKGRVWHHGCPLPPPGLNIYIIQAGPLGQILSVLNAEGRV